MRVLCKKDLWDPRKEVSDEKHRDSIASEEEALSLSGFQLKRWLTIDEHMNNYTKFLADLINMDVEIKEEDKMIILLNSLPNEEYETSVSILINS